MAFDISRGYMRQLHLGKHEVSLGKVTFSTFNDFNSEKYTQVNFRVEVTEI